MTTANSYVQITLQGMAKQKVGNDGDLLNCVRPGPALARCPLETRE